jgi:hypothetical protein
MKSLLVKFEHCYGIKNLEYEFDFLDRKTYAIYSPNGVMKTSFAKTFKDISEDNPSKDLIFPEKITKRIVKDDMGSDLSTNNVFVIEPYNETYKSEKVSVLLVNATLKSEYESIHESIDDKKADLIKALAKLSGLKSGIEEIISRTFTKTPTDFYKAIIRVKDEVLDDSPALFASIVYNKMFSERIEEFLSDPVIKSKIKEYITKYEELLGKSKFFKKGIFNHTNASAIAKNLKDNGFFKADHSVNLRSSSGLTEIKNETELSQVIEEEKQNILTNPELVSTFESIDKKLSANKELRDFRDYLLSNIIILPELANIEHFKEQVLISYFKDQKDLYEQLILEYEKGKIEIEKILDQAKNETTRWSFVIDEFNKRFSVPFKLSIGNQEQVILNSEAPIVQFEFKDDNGQKSVTESDLRNVLSTGEKRALYLLNIIFEVQARRESNIPTLFIIDDIADSFDYKNKYAIIEYLKDISEYPEFYQIILSHNYDFFRTVSGRLDMGRKQKLNTDKNSDGIKIYQEKYQNNPFTHWKKMLSIDNCMLIASIPFVRNIAEFAGEQDIFLKLTSLLHYKEDTDNITIEKLELLFKSILKDQSSLVLADHSKKVVDIIFEVAESLMADSAEQMELEKKVSLSIAIRLKAEIFMINKISDVEFWKSIEKDQAFALSNRLKQLPEIDAEIIECIDQVNLMTPENIHINSFMYEPILDMSNHHLKSLYSRVKAL